ncbi:hypothetical protein CgIS1_11605 [Frankia sp. CgS1]|nr:hypothetical protein CgIS1_11605 [Frankia sp. CgIS1]
MPLAAMSIDETTGTPSNGSLSRGGGPDGLDGMDTTLDQVLHHILPRFYLGETNEGESSEGWVNLNEITM